MPQRFLGEVRGGRAARALQERVELTILSDLMPEAGLGGLLLKDEEPSQPAIAPERLGLIEGKTEEGEVRRDLSVEDRIGLVGGLGAQVMEPGARAGLRLDRVDDRVRVAMQELASDQQHEIRFLARA